MQLPDYWLTRPAVGEGADHAADFEALLQWALQQEGCPTIAYDLPAPKWQFLCHVAEHHDLVVHGSGDPDIARFEPRLADDVSAFGNQRAVYAASDGLWAMFFAIVDRAGFGLSVVNACIRVREESGEERGPFYIFSVSQSALPRQPWRTGTVYLLPRRTFTPQAPVVVGSQTVHIDQLASQEPVVPLAKLTVTPADFPFLSQMRGHDDTRLAEYARALQSGSPWPED